VTPVGGPLRGRVVLGIGAGDGVGRATALHLAALGAAVVLAGPTLSDVVETAGLVAAAGGTVRVVEQPCPPCTLADAIRLATAALDAPTDLFLGADAYASPDDLAAAEREARASLAPGAHVTVLRRVPASEAKAAAERASRGFLEAAGR